MNLYKTLLSFTLLLFSIYNYAQFNTIIPISKDKTKIKIEKISDKNTSENEENELRKKNKKWLNITTKSQLKKEIDSLKKLVINFSEKTSLENRKKSIKDSLMFIAQIERFKKNSLSDGFAKMNFIVEEEFVENTNPRIFMPLKNKLEITSGFGSRFHPIFSNQQFHSGIDIKAYYEPVHSILDGIVTEAGWDSNGGGNYIKVKHSDQFETSYLHLSQIYYRAGETVKAGFVIGKSGNTGNSTGPHLHFSVKENGNFINPIKFLNQLIKTNNLIASYYGK